MNYCCKEEFLDLLYDEDLVSLDRIHKGSMKVYTSADARRAASFSPAFQQTAISLVLFFLNERVYVTKEDERKNLLTVDKVLEQPTLSPLEREVIYSVPFCYCSVASGGNCFTYKTFCNLPLMILRSRFT